MERYYFKHDESGECFEDCRVKESSYFENQFVKIGSCACKECEHNKAYGKNRTWIKCAVLDQALGK